MACGWRDGVGGGGGLWCAQADARLKFSAHSPRDPVSAEGRAGLENRSGRKATVGSNPTLSAISLSGSAFQGLTLFSLVLQVEITVRE